MKLYFFQVYNKIYKIESDNYATAIYKLAIILKKEKVINYIKQVDKSKYDIKIYSDKLDKKESEKEYNKIFGNRLAIQKLENFIDKK